MNNPVNSQLQQQKNYIMFNRLYILMIIILIIHAFAPTIQTGIVVVCVFLISIALVITSVQCKQLRKEKEKLLNLEKALYDSERSKAVLLDNLPGMAYRCNYDRDWTMQFVSAGCFNLTGYHPESLLHNKELSFNELIAPEYRDIICVNGSMW